MFWATIKNQIKIRKPDRCLTVSCGHSSLKGHCGFVLIGWSCQPWQVYVLQDFCQKIDHFLIQLRIIVTIHINNMGIISDISLQEFRQKYVLEGFDYPLQELFEDAKEFHFSGKNAKKGVLTQVFKKTD